MIQKNQNKMKFLNSKTCSRCHSELVMVGNKKYCQKCFIVANMPQPKFCKECHGKLQSSPEGKVCSICGIVASRKRRGSFKEYPNRKVRKNRPTKGFNVFENKNPVYLKSEKILVPQVHSKHFNHKDGAWERIIA